MSKLPSLSKKYVDPHAYPNGVAYMDEQYLPMSEAKISVLDYGFLHSDATYDVAHVWNGSFFRLDDHLNRFFAGMEKLHMSIPYDRKQIADTLNNCVGLSGHQNAYVEFICTRGTSPTFSRDPRDSVNRFIAFAIPFASIGSKEQMERGLSLNVSDIVRIPPPSLDPTIKNYHWLDLVQGLYQAYDQNADSCLLVDTNGNIAEGPGFNVFVIKDAKASTPQLGVLHGITRQTAFDVCKKLHLECQAKLISPNELLEADEVFITSTAGGVMPVTKINGRAIGSGQVGTLTKKVTAAYWDLHSNEKHRLPVTYPDKL